MDNGGTFWTKGVPLFRFLIMQGWLERAWPRYPSASQLPSVLAS